MAQGGDGFGFDLLAFGAGQSTGAGHGAGCGSGAGFLPVVLTGGGRVYRGFGAGAVYEVVHVIDRVALLDGDVFVTVGDCGGVAGFQGYLVAAVRVVVAPVGNGDGCARCGIVVCIIGFVDDGGVVFDLGDLAVVSYYAVVAAGDGCRTGGGGVGVRGERSEGVIL